MNKHQIANTPDIMANPHKKYSMPKNSYTNFKNKKNSYSLARDGSYAAPTTMVSLNNSLVMGSQARI